MTAQPPTPPGRPADRVIIDAAALARIVDRIAHQILERTDGGDRLVLLGIPTRGVPLAHRLTRRMHDFAGVTVACGALDVTPHRDDLALRDLHPMPAAGPPPPGVPDGRVVLVDDVLYSGRTARAALDALAELGRPAAVQLAVLVDRGHRELPIRADYVGKNLPTSQQESVRVCLVETDGADAVLLATDQDRR